MPPSDDTVFALLNCSIDSLVLNHYRYFCFTDVAGHSCDELYESCNAFKLFHMSSNTTAPACCFTLYSTMRFMSMNMLDCTHYITVVGAGGEGLRSVGPLDWVYGIGLSYAEPPGSSCNQCKRSGGACGFDTDSGAEMCLCSSAVNATRGCSKSISLLPWSPNLCCPDLLVFSSSRKCYRCRRKGCFKDTYYSVDLLCLLVLAAYSVSPESSKSA